MVLHRSTRNKKTLRRKLRASRRRATANSLRVSRSGAPAVHLRSTRMMRLSSPLSPSKIRSTPSRGLNRKAISSTLFLKTLQLEPGLISILPIINRLRQDIAFVVMVKRQTVAQMRSDPPWIGLRVGVPGKLQPDFSADHIVAGRQPVPLIRLHNKSTRDRSLTRANTDIVEDSISCLR